MEISKSNGNIKNKRPRRKRIHLYLLNDDINEFHYVIEILQTFIPMCNSLRAEQIAHIVHKAGRCDVYSGFAPEIYLIYSNLRKSGLNVELKINKK